MHVATQRIGKKGKNRAKETACKKKPSGETSTGQVRGDLGVAKTKRMKELNGILLHNSVLSFV